MWSNPAKMEEPQPKETTMMRGKKWKGITRGRERGGGGGSIFKKIHLRELHSGKFTLVTSLVGKTA
jgi:hypothetical protein